MPHFVEIVTTVAEISRFVDIQDGGRLHLWIFEMYFFEGQTASLCKISSQSRLRYGDFSICQDGGCRHLGFSKFEIFNVRNGQEGRTASPCQFSSKSLEPRPRYVSFNIMLVCLFTPLCGVFGAHFPQMMSLIVLTPKRAILGLNHVI